MDIPVLCVGNVTIGGTGKTPICIALMKLMQSRNIKPGACFLTRGYGGSEKGPVQAQSHFHPSLVGDEALQLTDIAPTWVSKNRFEGAKAAQEQGADMIIMDDGFQNRSLQKDIHILVIDGETGFGNEKLLPAGPMREPPASAFKKADAVIIAGEDQRGLKQSKIPADRPVFTGKIQTTTLPDPDAQYIAFAGIGRPEKFYNSLHEAGIQIAKTYSFGDHYAYTRRDVVSLAKEARHLGVKLITTEKDMRRLMPVKGDFEIETLPVEFVWEDKYAVLSFLRKQLGQTAS